jgi:hypothetical protein
MTAVAVTSFEIEATRKRVRLGSTGTRAGFDHDLAVLDDQQSCAWKLAGRDQTGHQPIDMRLQARGLGRHVGFSLGGGGFRIERARRQLRGIGRNDRPALLARRRLQNGAAKRAARVIGGLGEGHARERRKCQTDEEKSPAHSVPC